MMMLASVSGAGEDRDRTSEGIIAVLRAAVQAHLASMGPYPSENVLAVAAHVVRLNPILRIHDVQRVLEAGGKLSQAVSELS
jgi:hypothetical protein